MQIQAVFFLKTLVSTYKTTMFDVPKDYYTKMHHVEQVCPRIYKPQHTALRYSAIFT